VSSEVLYEVGEAVKVVGGPFQDFNGTVDDVNPALGKVRVLISLYGRATPLNLDFTQWRNPEAARSRFSECSTRLKSG